MLLCLTLSVCLSVSDSVSFSVSPIALCVSVSLSFFLSVFLGMSLCPCHTLSLPLVLQYFPHFCLSLPISISLFHLSCLVLPNTSSQIPRRPGQGSTPRPIFCTRPGAETFLLGARRDAGMDAACPCLGSGVEGLNVGREGQPPFPGSKGSALLLTRAQAAAGLDCESCGRPSPYHVPWLRSVEYPGGESTSPAFTRSYRRDSGQKNIEAKRSRKN